MGNCISQTTDTDKVPENDTSTITPLLKQNATDEVEVPIDQGTSRDKSVKSLQEEDIKSDETEDNLKSSDTDKVPENDTTTTTPLLKQNATNEVEVQIDQGTSRDKRVKSPQEEDIKSDETEANLKSSEGSTRNLSPASTGLHQNLKKAIIVVRKASEEDKKKDYEKALTLYECAVEYFVKALKCEVQSDKNKATIRDKCVVYLYRTEQIHKLVDKGINMKPINAGENWGKKETDDSKDEKCRKKLGKSLSGGIVKEKPNIKWEDVVGLERPKKILKETVILPAGFPQSFMGKRNTWPGVLLYGPAGTGKSYLAKAVATMANTSTFFSVSAADLISKGLGASETFVKILFSLARENKPSVIFIDDVDALCGSRGESKSKSAWKIKTEFLVQIIGLGIGYDGVLVLGATNKPWLLDQATRHSFAKRIYIPLPEAPARSLMFKIHFGNTANSLTEEDFRILGEKSEGYSGADILGLVQDALMQNLRKVQTATPFRKVCGQARGNPNVTVGGLLTPCSPGAPEAVAMNWTQVPENKLMAPIIGMTDMLISLHTHKPSVNGQDLIKLQEFRDVELHSEYQRLRDLLLRI